MPTVFTAIPGIRQNRLREDATKFILRFTTYPITKKNQSSTYRKLSQSSLSIQIKIAIGHSVIASEQLHILLTHLFSKFRIASRGVTEFIQAPKTRLDQRSLISFNFKDLILF